MAHFVVFQKFDHFSLLLARISLETYKNRNRNEQIEFRNNNNQNDNKCMRQIFT